MELTKSQVAGFIEAILGCHITTAETGEGDYVSPVVAAYLSGVMPTMPTAYELYKVVTYGEASSDEYRQRGNALADFLDAVSSHLRTPAQGGGG